MTKKKPVWIYESGAMKLVEKVEGEKGAYIFEGLAADFERNENGRIYSKEDYLSHLGYLNEKISEGSLWGELDHPERYNVQVKEASHIIKELKFDEQSETVRIKIELFDNIPGDHVKGIVDKGGPVFISSRASGFIDDDGNVVLERIYTYDIVYEPGFKNAKLKRLNESLGMDAETNIAIYEMRSPINTEEKNNSMSTKDKAAVTNTEEKPASIEAAFNDYTNKTSEMFEGFKKNMESMKKLLESKDAASNPDLVQQLNEVSTNFNTAMEQWEAHSLEFNGYKVKIDETHSGMKKLEAKFDAITKWAVANDKKTTNVMEFSQKLANHVNIMAEIVNENVGETVGFKERITEHVNLITNLVNENLEEIEGNVTQIKQYHDIAAESTNEMIDVIKDKIVPHLNTVTEQVNELSKEDEAKAGKLGSVISHLNTVSNVTNENLVAKAEFAIGAVTGTVAEGFTGEILADGEAVGKISFTKKDRKIEVSESFKSVEAGITGSPKLQAAFEALYFEQYGIGWKVLESIKANNPKNISKSVDEMILKAKNKGALSQSQVHESKYPFLKVVSDESKAQFINLSEAKKSRVASEVVNKTLLRKNEIENAISVVESIADERVVFESYLTGTQVERWQKLDEERKEIVHSMFNMRNIVEKIGFDGFFEGLDWRTTVTESLDTKQPAATSLNEAAAVNLLDDDNGYADKMLRL